jgi:hypothetical protein
MLMVQHFQITYTEIIFTEAQNFNILIYINACGMLWVDWSPFTALKNNVLCYRIVDYYQSQFHV